MKEQVVLLTGCSSGIGRALALEFHERGHQVVATARRLESLADLAERGMLVLSLDVTDGESIQGAVQECLEQRGRIDLLVNNAGFGLMGPVVELSLEKLRLQFETNVIGVVALIQVVIPAMVEQGSGRIVNVGSVSGVMATPFAGAYCASKAAVHFLSDALRVEVAPFGIKVIQVQPGAVRSSFGETASADLDRYKESPLYGGVAEDIHQRAQTSQEGSVSAEAFASKTVDAVLRPDPPAVFRYGPHSTRLPLLKALVPTKMLDRKLTQRFGLDKLSRKK